MMNKTFSIFFILFFSFLHSTVIDGPIHDGIKYTFSINKTELKDDDIIINLEINAKINDGWYMQSSNPDLAPAAPTDISLDNLSKFRKINQMLETPEPTIKYEKLFQRDIGKHYKSVQFSQEIIPKDDVVPGVYNLVGEFNYQICTNLACYPHSDVFDFEIIINDYNNYVENISIWTKISDMIGSFFIAFIAGLIAIITPCVFPMIPMTVAFFAKGSKKGTKESMKTGITFGLSIIMIFMIIGLLFSFVFGSADLANQLATSAVANIIFAVIFLVFAISFFGYFEIQVPTGLLNKINKKADGGGLIGTFFMALTLVLVSFSCTAPIVGTVMIDAISGDVLKPVVMMLGFSLAFAIPFSLFAIFPGWLETLPQSGGWLNSVKIVLGFLELALCIKFLSMPDQAYHWGILSREVFLIIWIIIFVLMGLYIIGLIKFKSDSGIKVSFGITRITSAVVTFGFCIYMAFGLFGGNVSLLAGVIPPPKPPNPTIGHNGEDVLYSDKLHLPYNLRGYFDYEDGRKIGKELDKPLFLDFTGHACFNCRRMEENVWKDSTVHAMLDTDYVVIALYVDDRTPLPNDPKYKNIGRKNLDFQINKFNSAAQPFYVLLDPYDTTMTPLVEPRAYNTNTKEFIDFLDKGLEEYEIRYWEREDEEY